MKNLSKFDLGMIIAFAVIGLMGGGAWWWFSGQAEAALQDVRAAKAKYDSLSTTDHIVVSLANEKTLKDNIDLYKAQLDPLVETKLNAKDSKLAAIDKEDSVAWKHELDDRIRGLNKDVRDHGIKVPSAIYYFSFSRYTSSSPEDEKTLVLSKQLLAVEQLSTILIKAPVKAITSIRRTYQEEEAAPKGGNNTSVAIGPATEPDRLTGYAFKSPGGDYTVYPYEIEFDTTVDGLRKVIDGVTATPYIFVIRSLAISNVQTASPQTGTLATMAGTPTQPVASVTDSAPGDVAATSAPPVKGPQYLFGNSLLHVRARIDLVEWNGGN